jgi:PAS domain S-box-containing protein
VHIAVHSGENVEKPTILIVEDERVVALDLRAQLRRMGYYVPAIVSRGSEAVRLTAELDLDLVLMDIHLQGEMDGVQAAQAIHNDSDVPVIYLTAYADQVTLDRAKVSEPSGYIIKPFDEQELHATIEMALYKHQMQRKLRESQRWLSAVLESIGDAVIATDQRGRIKFMNPVAESLTGWNKSEADDKDIGEVFHVLDRETKRPVQDPALRALADNKVTLLDAGAVLVSRTGDEIPVGDSAAPIRDERGNLVGAVLVFRDETERTQAQQALEQHARDLEEKNQELDAFAHTVAHDLKDPLSTIAGFASILADGELDLPKDELQQYLRIIEGRTLQASGVIDELLLLSSVRKAEVSTEPLAMSRILSRAEYRLAYLKQERHAEIARPSDWPVALGYGPWVEEVWTNYLSNGIKYGGDPPRLQVGATCDGPMVRFWVRDNGQGIPAKELDRLFTPFTRLHQVRATGHGLGLSIVQRIVRKLGGTVGVESEEGQGSIFYFTLPAASESDDKERPMCQVASLQTPR